jgi:peptidoglycan/xylan/chitin deacetylase (PgdA/CDA1 family)
MISEHLPKSESKFNRLRVKPKEFDKQIKWLSSNGWTSYTLSELVKLKDIPNKSVVITFDDGYEDNFSNALPILKKYNFKATVYIVLNRFDNNWATDKDLNESSDELNNEKMLTDEEVHIMLQSGLIEIGSHTLNHSNLPSLSINEKKTQIHESKKVIEKLFNIKCESFAYPFGFYDTKDIELVDQSNYLNATTVVNDVYKIDKYSNKLIPRIMISGRQSMLNFILKINKGRSR